MARRNFQRVDLQPDGDGPVVRFPFAPFSSIEVIALSDLDKSLASAKAFGPEMMAGMAKP